MREMILAMGVLAVALAGAKMLEHAGVEHTIWAIGLVGGAGGLAGGAVLQLLRQARG
jgi:hypothetical protein